MHRSLLLTLHFHIRAMKLTLNYTYYVDTLKGLNLILFMTLWSKVSNAISVDQEWEGGCLGSKWMRVRSRNIDLAIVHTFCPTAAMYYSLNQLLQKGSNLEWCKDFFCRYWLNHKLETLKLSCILFLENYTVTVLLCCQTVKLWRCCKYDKSLKNICWQINK